MSNEENNTTPVPTVNTNSVDYVSPEDLARQERLKAKKSPKPKAKAKTGKKKGEREKGDPKNKDFSHMFWGMGEILEPTGIHALDIVLGGGYERGDIIEIFGEPGLGKTTLLMELCSRFVQKGKTIAFIDVENAVKNSFLVNCGIDPSIRGPIAGKHQFFTASPTNFLELQEICDYLLRDLDKPYDIMIIDSLSNVNEYSENLSIESNEIGVRARQETKFFSKFKGDFRRTKTTVFIVNQLRNKSSGQTVRFHQDSTGGYASKHNFDVRLKLKSGPEIFHQKGEETITGDKLKASDGVPYGRAVQMYAEKNKSTRPRIPVPLHVIWGKGISNSMFLYEVLTNKGDLQMGGRGYWGFLEDIKGVSFSGAKGQGKEICFDFIQEHEEEIVKYLEDSGCWKLVSNEG